MAKEKESFRRVEFPVDIRQFFAEQGIKVVVDENISIQENVLIIKTSHHRNSEGADLQSQPPKKAAALLDLFLPHSIRESLIGDLEEEYRTRIAPNYSPGFAKRWYWLQATRSLAAIAWNQVRIWAGVALLAKAVGWFTQRFGQ